MKLIFIVVVLLFSLLACNPNNEGKLPPPDEVVMVEKYTDLGAIEHGIDAVPDEDGIYVEWYLLADPDVTSYNIYRKLKNESIFKRLTSISVENVISPFDTVFSYIDDENIVLDNSEFVYYYYVTATNRDGVAGPVPDSTTKFGYSLLNKPSTNVTPDISSSEQPILIWQFQGGNIPNYYIIRIEDQILESLIWTRRFQNENLERDKVKDLSTVTNPPVFQSGSIYRWRIDAVGPDSLYSGSESNWKTFFVN
jgi:hypothetical protein